MKINTNPIRGTYDYAPKQAELREEVRQVILRTYQNNGFSLINTPILENLELLNGSDGGDNLKLMFKTIKRGEKLDLNKLNLTEKDITEEGLRYDLTVPLARFYANNKESLPNPFKAIQIDYSFRAERPQKGRDRQFTQCDIDILGDDSVESEIDVLTTGISAYQKLGFDNLVVKINSREVLNSILEFVGFDKEDFSTVCVSLDKVDKIGLQGVKEELEAKFLVRENKTGDINKLISALDDIKQNALSVLSNYGVNDRIVKRLDCIINTINNAKIGNIKCEFDISIIRGQGYYTGIVYEVYSKDFSGAIGGGGRYDKMIEKIIGVNVPAVGFSIGFSRVCMLLDEQAKKMNKNQKIALIYDESDFEKAFIQKQQLIENYDISLYKRPKNLKALLEKLQKINYDGFILCNDNTKTEIKFF